MWTKVLIMLLAHMSPALIELARQGAREFRKRAEETDNPIDDIIAHSICRIVESD